MVKISEISRIIVKLNKIINFHGCRLYSNEPREKLKSAHSVAWSINGSNSSYSSVNTILHVPSTKIAFNCGEGLQRLIDEDTGKHLTSVKHIFITRLDWKCVAGMSGILATQNVRGTKHLNVFGPSQLNILCSRIMKSIGKSKLDVTTVDCDNGHTYTDSSFCIRAIPLRNPSEENARVIAYVGDVYAHRSAILIDRCVDLNVPAGPLISQLAKGYKVTLDDGSVVWPTDVCNSSPKLNFLGKFD